MITVEEALSLVDSNTVKTEKVEKIKLSNLLGRVLSGPIYSSINMPPFRQSAMDGYAVKLSKDINEYKVIGESAAGSSEDISLQEGESVRIFTGAAVPTDANTVIKQEIVKREGDIIQFTEPVSTDENIRSVGEQISVDQLAFEANSILTPPGIGFLASLGYDTALVFCKPMITIIATGDELIKPGSELEYGKIFESNTFMLASGLDKYGYNNYRVLYISDDYDLTKASIEKALSESDVLVLSGGISVGDYDFVGKALKELNVEEIFYKVKQKPGKPLFYGKLNGKSVFALPGNPAAAMTSFYVYVLPALNKISGKGFEGLQSKSYKINEDYNKKGERAEFLKALVNGDEVEILESQSSAMLNSFAMANALLYVPLGIDKLEKGAAVKTLVF